MAGGTILVTTVVTAPGRRPGGTAVDPDVRRNLIESLKSRSWSDHDAERVATRIEALYKLEPGEWQVVLWEVAGGEQSVYLVARKVDGPSVFDSPLEMRARDVANALNEVEDRGSEKG
jgi:hypothetical protein